jgi:hypothetical protein
MSVHDDVIEIGGPNRGNRAEGARGVAGQAATFDWHFKFDQVPAAPSATHRANKVH